MLFSHLILLRQTRWHKANSQGRAERRLLTISIAFFAVFMIPMVSGAESVWPTEASEIETILKETRGPLPYIPASDRETWQTVRENLGMEMVGNCLAAAAERADEPMPVLPASVYLQVER
ncbi:MAG: hypothetical protein ABIH23_01635, partial [bacterium]